MIGMKTSNTSPTLTTIKTVIVVIGHSKPPPSFTLMIWIIPNCTNIPPRFQLDTALTTSSDTKSKSTGGELLPAGQASAKRDENGNPIFREDTVWRVLKREDKGKIRFSEKEVES